MSYSKNRAIVLAVTEGAMTTSQAATHFDTSPRHIRRLLAQYRQHGLKGLEPKSRKPHHNPNATNQQTIEAYWVLFRFLYGGQLTDPVLIIACDNLLWGSV
ncbi:MAG: helix-turn-helix domain-containing protein, partial [Varibaculum cambriense]|uniref:helix-turn-helix domain-containing protein n=1 Tax=Varibaculum cambriense TaxID=184870 RepID=UPI002900587F